MIALAHLVWGPLGPGRLRDFLGSYRRYAPGIEHELVVLLNGVSDAQRTVLAGELEGLQHRMLPLPEAVQDLTAYRQAAERLEHERVCFVNSYSAILAEDWLAKLSHALDQPEAGLVAATGSWASVRSAILNAFFLPNRYRGVVPGRKIAREQLAAIERELGGNEVDHRKPPRRPSLAMSVMATLRTLPAVPGQLLHFDGFPAEHLRTNAFMANRGTFLGLRTGRIASKMDAYRLESGHHSLTRQIQRRGLRALVVDRDGAFYDPPDWPASRTLWQGNQEGLLIADNQTRLYANGGMDRRRVLSTFAWGRHADPRLPHDGLRE